MSKKLASLIEAEIQAMREMEPVQRGHRAQLLMAVCDEASLALAAVRASAFRELRDGFGWTLQDLAEEYRISRSRAHQVSAF